MPCKQATQKAQLSKRRRSRSEHMKAMRKMRGKTKAAIDVTKTAAISEQTSAKSADGENPAESTVTVIDRSVRRQDSDKEKEGEQPAMMERDSLSFELGAVAQWY